MKEAVIGFIGAGNMASSIIRGLIEAGKEPSSIFATDIDESKLESLADETGIRAASTGEICTFAEVLVLAVKPQTMRVVCIEIANIGATHLMISVAAGVRTAQLERWLSDGAAIVRCMPNTPALIGEGITGLFANKLVNKRQKELAQSIMDAVGLTVWLSNEKDIDTVTALSGSGPAYFFLLMEAMQEVAQELGLEQEVAENLVCQTAIGASQLARKTEDSAVLLRKKVTSPGGTTEKAISEFEDGNFRGLVRNALIAAKDRSIELSEDLSN